MQRGEQVGLTSLVFSPVVAHTGRCVVVAAAALLWPTKGQNASSQNVTKCTVK